MNWIKRNLFFVIGSVVALALIGFAGFYNWTAWKHNAEEREKLNQMYEDLKRLNNQTPHPGYGKVDNIKLAREQQAEIRKFLSRAIERFEPIPPIPDVPTVTSEAFASTLRSTLDQLTRDAANNGVTLPGAPASDPALSAAPAGFGSAYGGGLGAGQKFTFSFSVQSQRVQFSPPLEPLAVQLGEVKVICDILNQAKVNSLDQLRRERVSPDDQSGPQTDYLEGHSQTNELAILTPYEVTFHCFTPELAQVVSGFANSPHGMVVKSINVEPSAMQPVLDQPAPMAYIPQPIQPQPGFFPPRGREGEGGEAFARRYGVGPGGPGGYAPPPPVAPVYMPVPVAAGSAKGALKTVLDEKQLRVVMTIQIVKPQVKK